MSIKSYIKNDLRARLLSGQSLPGGLTLDSLAGHYDVSFTPIRAALAELVAEGVLSRGPNRSLHRTTTTINCAKNGDEATELPAPPRDLLEVVSNDLVRLSFAGEAVYLREEAVARQYGVSRSAMRNVFHRLSGEGLLNHIPRRGWQLRPFRQEDMHAFLEVRELLELKALDLAVPRLEESDLRGLLERCVAPAPDSPSMRVDNSLHAYIIDKSGNPYIKDFLDRHGRYYEILFDWEDQDHATAVETVRQHRQILEAMLRKDWQSARSALSWHICCNHPILSQVAERLPQNLSASLEAGGTQSS